MFHNCFILHQIFVLRWETVCRIFWCAAWCQHHVGMSTGILLSPFYTLSWRIDRMKTEFHFKFAALALQFNWKMQLNNTECHAQSKRLSLNFNLACHFIYNGGKLWECIFVCRTLIPLFFFPMSAVQVVTFVLSGWLSFCVSFFWNFRTKGLCTAGRCLKAEAFPSNVYSCCYRLVAFEFWTQYMDLPEKSNTVTMFTNG